MIAPDFLAMPPELCRVPRWVVHKQKVPYQAAAINSKASSTDPTSWASFDKAQAAYQEGGYDGVGFVLNGDGLVGVDLDKCVHEGEPQPAALGLLERVGCEYIELSPSGTGLRGFGYGDNITGRRGLLDGINVELYASQRYLTVTGHAIKRGPLVPLNGFSEVTNAIRPSDLQKSTEDYGSHLLSSSVLFCRYPATTLPGQEGQRNHCLFELARYVKGKHPDATRQELRDIVRGWHDLVLPVIETKDFAVTLTDFMRGWEKVRQPHGSTMSSIVANLDSVPLPQGVEALGYGKHSNHLVRLCVALQAHHGQEPFFISAREAGEQIGVHFTDASKMLSALCFDGVLTLVTKGAGKVASRYRYNCNQTEKNGPCEPRERAPERVEPSAVSRQPVQTPTKCRLMPEKAERNHNHGN